MKTIVKTQTQKETENRSNDKNFKKKYFDQIAQFSSDGWQSEISIQLAVFKTHVYKT